MKINHKIIVGFSVIVCLTALICLGGAMRLEKMSSQYHFQLKAYGPISDLLQEILIGGLRVVASTSEVLMLSESEKIGDAIDRSLIAEEIKEVREGFHLLIINHERFNELTLQYFPERANVVEDLGVVVDRLINSSINLIDASEGMSEKDMHPLKKELEEADDRFYEVVNRYISESNIELKREQGEMALQAVRTRNLLYFLTSIALLGAFIAVIIILRPFQSGLKQLAEASEQIAQGNLNIKYEHNRLDEFGDLSAEFKRMADEIRSARNLADWSHLEVEKHAADLEAKSKEYEEFVFIASHDLQEPLRKIMTYSSLILKGLSGNVGEEYQGFVSKIIESSSHLREKLDILSEYSQIVTSEEPFKRVSLEEIVAKVTNRYIRIMGDLAAFEIGTLPTIEGRVDQLEKMFNCLFDNSCKFIGEEPLEVKVSSDVLDKENYCRIIFEDNGRGFDQKYAGTIFRIFHSLDHHGSEGFGMGLAIVKRIVEVHGGSISVKSCDGSGTRFTMIFPISQKGRQKWEDHLTDNKHVMLPEDHDFK